MYEMSNTSNQERVNVSTGNDGQVYVGIMDSGMPHTVVEGWRVIAEGIAMSLEEDFWTRKVGKLPRLTWTSALALPFKRDHPGTSNGHFSCQPTFNLSQPYPIRYSSPVAIRYI